MLVQPAHSHAVGYRHGWDDVTKASAAHDRGAARPADFASELDIASTWAQTAEAALTTINPDGTGPYYSLDPAPGYKPSAVRRDLGWEAELR